MIRRAEANGAYHNLTQRGQASQYHFGYVPQLHRASPFFGFGGSGRSSVIGWLIPGATVLILALYAAHAVFARVVMREPAAFTKHVP